MYHAYFGFNQKPFQINADPKFLWMGEKHTEALWVLRYGVMEKRGFLLLTGDVGTGKTTLLNAFLADLPPNVLVARIPDPRLDLMDFINILSDIFGMNETFRSKGPFLVQFEAFLKRQHYLGRTVLLIIDEAQRLTNELLEEIRALSNLEKPEVKLLNVFFVGQEEFNNMLLDQSNKAIRQRITISYHLEPLNRKEVGKYIWHRQKVAGAQKNLFTRRAIDFIYKFSGGFPRTINIICDHALLSAYANGKRFVSNAIISECTRDFGIRSLIRPAGQPINPVPFPDSVKQSQTNLKSHKTNLKKWLTAMAVMLFVLFGSYVAYRGIPESAQWLEFIPIKQINSKQTELSAKIHSPQTLVSENKSKLRPANADDGSAAKKDTTSAKIEQPGQIAQPDLKRETHNNSVDDITVSAELNEEVPSRLATKTNIYKKLMVYFLHDVYILDQLSLETLDQARLLMREIPELRAYVVGYTDSLGDPNYNQHLSKLRADIVKNYLIGNGVEAEKIDSEGLGSLNPMVSNQTPEGRMQNRRVEIQLYVPAQ